MSGGSYDYAYRKVSDMADTIQEVGACSCASPAIRAAFAKHLHKVAAAMKAIEWNDSGDGADDEKKLILECIGQKDVLENQIEKAIALRLALERSAYEISQALNGGKA